MSDVVATRPTQSFTIFFRTTSGEGGYLCHRCGSTCSDSFSRLSHAFAVATQHLTLCRGDVSHRPVEGTAIIDGSRHTAILREGVMIIALDPVFRSFDGAVRAIA